MAVVNPTTKISAASVDQGDRWTDADDTTSTYVSGWPATISAPSGRGARGTQEVVEWTLYCDPLPRLEHLHEVTDEPTGLVYQVQWVAQVGGALPHTMAGLTRVTGGAVSA